MDGLLNGLLVGNLAHVGIVLDLKLATEVLRADELDGDA